MVIIFYYLLHISVNWVIILLLYLSIYFCIWLGFKLRLWYFNFISHKYIYIYETCNGTTLLSTPFVFFVCLEIFVFQTSFKSDVNYQLDLFQHLNWQLYLKHLFCFLHPYLPFPRPYLSTFNSLSQHSYLFLPPPLNLPQGFVYNISSSLPTRTKEYYGLRSRMIGSRLKQQFLTSGNIISNMLHSKSLK